MSAAIEVVDLAVCYREVRAVPEALPLEHLDEGMLDLTVRGEGPSAVLVPMAVLAAFAVVVRLAAARISRSESA